MIHYHYTKEDLNFIKELLVSFNYKSPNTLSDNVEKALAQYKLLLKLTGGLEEEAQEDLEFANKYEVFCYNQYGICLKTYDIEADHIEGAKDAALDFFKGEYPCERLTRMEIIDEKGEPYWFKEGEIYG